MTRAWLAVALTVLVAAAPAAAQAPGGQAPGGQARGPGRGDPAPAELGAARDLFQEGLAAAHDERWEEARAAFERSLAIVERPSTLLNLAGAQAQTGRVVEAAATYRRFLEIATAREERHRPGAESALREVEARIAHVTVEAEGADRDDRAELDGAAIGLGEPIAIDPGAHEAVVLRGDEVIGRRSFSVAGGETTTVSLALRAPRSDDDAALPDPTPAPGEDLTWVWVGVGIGAAVVVGVAIGVGVAVGTSGPSYYGGNLGDGMIRF